MFKDNIHIKLTKCKLAYVNYLLTLFLISTNSEGNIFLFKFLR